MKYEMEIKLDHEFEVMYHTFNDLTQINEELEWLMNLESPIEVKLITPLFSHALSVLISHTREHVTHLSLNKVCLFYNY